MNFVACFLSQSTPATQTAALADAFGDPFGGNPFAWETLALLERNYKDTHLNIWCIV